ncbi:MAG: hypothetical protein AAB606_00830 [Patescibacteria group bacterium]
MKKIIVVITVLIMLVAAFILLRPYLNQNSDLKKELSPSGTVSSGGLEE